MKGQYLDGDFKPSKNYTLGDLKRAVFSSRFVTDEHLPKGRQMFIGLNPRIQWVFNKIVTSSIMFFV
jgi:hypothetical protein